MKNAVFKLSYSKINSFIYCKYKYYLQYIKRAKGIAIDTFKSGEIYHRIIENFWNDKRRWSLLETFFEKEADLLLQKCNVEFRRANIKESVKVSQQVISNFLMHVLEVSKNIQEICGIEKKFNYKVSENVAVTGKIDFAYLDRQNLLHIVDYKTGKNLPVLVNNKIIGTEESLQLNIYNIAGRLVFPHCKNVKCYLYFLRFGKPIGTSGHTVVETRDYLVNIANEMLTTTNFTKSNKWCNFCTFKEICK